MKDQNKKPSKNTLSCSLIVPNDIALLSVVRSFASTTAQIAGFEDAELLKFELIAEEAFVYTLTSAFEEDEESEIKLVASIGEVEFVLSFFDKGLPFGVKPYETGDDISELQLKIIRNTCYKLEWINHGKQGKELRIRFRRPRKAITSFKPPTKEKQEPPTDNISIEILNPEDAYQVTRLIYKAYGYTYPNEDMYYPEVVESLNRQGKLVSIVAVDKTYGRVVGHYAIERYDHGDVVELGLAVVGPEYRGRGIVVKMRQKLEEVARSLNILGIYSQPVTSHTRTQKLNEKFGSTPCGVSFGLLYKEFSFRKMDIKPGRGRETCMFYFKPLEFKPRHLHIPEKHREMVMAIYSKLGLRIVQPERERFSSTTQVTAKFSSIGEFGIINVPAVGRDLSSKVKNALYQLRLSTGAEVILLNISMYDARIDEFLPELEQMGFFFCGVVPYAFNGKDAIRFQYLNSKIDLSRIQIYSDFAKTLFDYSVRMMKEVMGNVV